MAGPRSPARTAIRLGPAMVRFTGRSDGDVGRAGEALDVDRRRRAVIDRPWRWVHQVHGNSVVWASSDQARSADADALITDDPAVAIAVFTADCAPVALASPEGVIAAVHAGWRGVRAGVLEAAAAALRASGASSILGALGPCIRPCCYEFSEADLAGLVHRYGEGIRGATRDGRLALDLPAAVTEALAAAEVDLVYNAGACTSCTPGYFSHRARSDSKRQAGVVWLP